VSLLRQAMERRAREHEAVMGDARHVLQRMQQCIHCGVEISAKSQTGRCRRCHNRDSARERRRRP